MPIYEYNCEHCNYKFDRIVSTSQTQVKCPICQGKTKKLMSTFSVGGSHHVSDNIPAAANAGMCTSCGVPPAAFKKH